jgi:hypothetical protein
MIQRVKVQPFESEFADSDLPTIDGTQLSHSVLRAHMDGLPASHRVSRSQQDVVVDAVGNFYLAKRFREIVLPFDGFSDGIGHRALEAIGFNLMRQAVISVAAANDPERGGRTTSLPHLLWVLKKRLDDHASATGDDVSREVVAIDELAAEIDHTTVPSLKYVYFVRNKWAGHTSLDREFDDWADADSALSIPIVEDALVRLVNAHGKLVKLVAGSRLLQQITQAPATPASDEIQMSIDWSATTVWADIERDWAGKAAQAILNQLQVSAAGE